MKTTLRVEKSKATEPMKEYANDKLSKLDKYMYNPELVTATILVKKRDGKDKVEVTIPFRSMILRAEETQQDFYAAIDVVIDKLERQIRRNKTRLKKTVNKTKDVPVFDMSSIEEDESPNKDKVVKRKSVEVKPMSEEEAILQMEMIGHQFYLYKDSDTNKATVVYKRNDGGYGVIESE